MYFPKDGWALTFIGESVPGSVTINTDWFGKLINPKKPNHNAPKSIKGDYDLSIHGNKIVLVDNVDGTTVEAKCHPDDDFDISIGIKEAFKKLNEKREEDRKCKEEETKEIKVGDWVKVVNSGASYATHTDFFVKNNIPVHYCVNYRYGEILNNGEVGKVLFIVDDKAVIESKFIDDTDFEFDDAIYLIGLRGLKKVKKPNV